MNEYYGHRYGPDPWYYPGHYDRDRVHVASKEDVKAFKELETK